jgi:anthranilate phosphoribosyltransferase
MKALLGRLLDGEDLTEAEAASVMAAMASGTLDPALAGGLLVALRLKGETAAEVRGFAREMRALALCPSLPPLDRPLVDIVGTGGDGSSSLNLSTTAALLAAAAGCAVVKHGNRAVSSRSGSADVLEALGLLLPLDAEAAGDLLVRTGYTFLFARHYHPAMRHIAPVRRALGARTVFNLLGPLTNPAAPPHLLLGAFSPAAARLMAAAVAELPITRAFVVHGAPGWDEPTPVGPFLLLDVQNGTVDERLVDPLEVYGLPRCTPGDLAGGDPAYNAAAIRSIAAGTPGAPRAAVVLGAALALELTGLAASPTTARAMAEAAIDDGRMARVIEGLRQ